MVLNQYGEVESGCDWYVCVVCAASSLQAHTTLEELEIHLTNPQDKRVCVCDVFVLVYTCVCMYVYTCVRVHVCMCVCVYTCQCVCVRV